MVDNGVFLSSKVLLVVDLCKVLFFTSVILSEGIVFRCLVPLTI